MLNRKYWRWARHAEEKLRPGSVEIIDSYTHKVCDNEDCDRIVKQGIIACCGLCENGTHTESCNERYKERGPAPLSWVTTKGLF